MVAKHGLQRDKWVSSVYEKRSSWATTHLRDQFFGGIHTTSVCEATNSRIKLYITKRHNLVDIFNELVTYYRSLFTKPVLTTFLYKFESEIAKLYTRETLGEVRTQIESVTPLNFMGTKKEVDEVKDKMNK